ncbi:MAG: TrmB family transcriptional regulator [Firmicutes bacterium]|nr:TrmB family transcriptional regulator [Candidatus Fermentithermobacillaceae bacterium]
MIQLGIDERNLAIDSMVQLGFTEYEAKTYLALLKDNPATGYQISKNAGIPRSMVYEALGRLSNKGAVMSIPTGDTTRYAPIPVTTLLDTLRHKYEDALDTAQEVLSKEESQAPQEQVWNLSGYDLVISRAREMVRHSKKEILGFLDDRTLVVLFSDLKDAYDRGISTRLILIGEAEVDFGHVMRHPIEESELQNIARSIVLVSDNNETLIGGTAPSDTCVWTANNHVVFIARQFIWQEMFTQKAVELLGKEILSMLTDEERKAILWE